MATTSARRAKGSFDLVLRLLDHQIVGSGGELLGNVDNLELGQAGDDLVVTGIVVGPAGLGPRLPGKLGRWTVAIWRRLSTSGDPTATVLPMKHVVRVGPGIDIDERGSSALAEAFGLEHWLRWFVISRIPGAAGDEDGPGGKVTQPASSDDGRRLAPAEASHLVSDLLGREVTDPDGQFVGHVCGLLCEPIGSPRAQAGSRGQSGSSDHLGPLRIIGPLRITGIAYGKRPTGSMLGYRADRRQGPIVLAALLRAWHRDDRHVPIGGVDKIDWEATTITLRPDAHPTHPHDDA